uniref:DUF4328 domain-containing protein n=1 Tax=Flavobacterium sp. TaxID=239 RepID=UPI00404AE09F
MVNLRPNEERAKNAITMLWIMLIMEIVSMISSGFQYDLLQVIENNGDYSFAQVEANDLREQIIAILYLVLHVISIITFIQWFRRAYFNLHTRVNHLNHAEGWAAGSWFVPIIGLYRPYHIMVELYEETKIFLTKNNIRINQEFSTKAVSWWWTLWIISNFFSQIVFRYSNGAEEIDELRISTFLSIVINIISIPLTFVTIKVVRDYAEVEPLLNKVQDDFYDLKKTL